MHALAACGDGRDRRTDNFDRRFGPIFVGVGTERPRVPHAPAAPRGVGAEIQLCPQAAPALIAVVGVGGEQRHGIKHRQNDQPDLRLKAFRQATVDFLQRRSELTDQDIAKLFVDAVRKQREAMRSHSELDV